MATLIIGALVIVGVLAIVGIVYLLRSGNRENAPIASSEEVASVSSAEPEPQETSSAPIDEAAPQLEDVTDATTPLSSVPLDTPDNEQHIVLNGQFHELVDQLRVLHEQAREIEQRLSKLNEMVEHIGQR